MKIKIINKSNNPLPQYKSKGASGMDLQAFIKDYITLFPFKQRIINTGIFIEIPIGFEAQIRSRSGLALKNGIICLNSPGTIDSDYRGEIMVILINISSSNFIINNGDRIAQMIIAPYIAINWESSKNISNSSRNQDGFGSTGR